MIKRFVAAWIAVVVFVVVGFVSFAEAPDTYDVFNELKNRGLDVYYLKADEDLGDVPNFVPVIECFEASKVWVASYNYKGFSCSFINEHELNAIAAISGAVQLCYPDDWDGMIVLMFYEKNPTGCITDVVDFNEWILKKLKEV